MLKLIIKIFLVSLISTIIIELLVAFLLKVKNKKDFLNIILVNILTNPLLVMLLLYINIRYGLLYRNILVYPLEIIVVIVEGLVYKKYLDYKKIKPILLALILNASSYIFGLLINLIVY